MSGEIDISELHNICIKNGLQITKDEVRQIFDLCKTKSKGFLTREEFKDLYKNPKAD